jgi:diguanylate cyclase (GGDEF)-like protein
VAAVASIATALKAKLDSWSNIQMEGAVARVWRDRLALFALCALLFFTGSKLSLFDAFAGLNHVHPGWRLSDWFSVWVLLSGAGFVYAFRRSHDLKRELVGRQEAEDKIRTMALHDPLTGLANRRKLHDALASALKARKRPGAVTALLMVDLDRFKPVNDLHGHGVGDRVLKEVADRLREVVREGDLVARTGGDEFAILLADCEAPDEASRPARRVIEAMRAPVRLDELVCQVGATLGVATAGAEPVDPETLIHRADVALYRAKKEGRGQFRFFEEEMDSQIRARARLEMELRQALAAGQITPFYQPLVDLKTGDIKGYEVLSRWNHPDGMIMPEVFIPIAEDTGLIGELTMRVLVQACLDARDWPADATMAVNVSPVLLRDRRLPQRFLAILQQTGFPAHRLEVEITENALVEDFQQAKQILNALKAFGVRIALDDFGTGYSSLNHLRELPFDKLKIDRSFIASMETCEDSRKIVDAIVGLGHSLGLVTVAEGIEDIASADRLSALGCQLGQGFWFGHPSPVAETNEEAERQVA